MGADGKVRSAEHVAYVGNDAVAVTDSVLYPELSVLSASCVGIRIESQDDYIADI